MLLCRQLIFTHQGGYWVDGMPEDFFTIDLMEAYQQLGLINGDTATEDLVNKIFEEFCMGK